MRKVKLEEIFKVINPPPTYKEDSAAQFYLDKPFEEHTYIWGIEIEKPMRDIYKRFRFTICDQEVYVAAMEDKAMFPIPIVADGLMQCRFYFQSPDVGQIYIYVD